MLSSGKGITNDHLTLTTHLSGEVCHPKARTCHDQPKYQI